MDKPMYPEDVADEIQRCIAQVDYEFSTPFKQFTVIGDEIDIQTEDGSWFRVKVTRVPH